MIHSVVVCVAIRGFPNLDSVVVCVAIRGFPNLDSVVVCVDRGEAEAVEYDAVSLI